jgi:hypothetical protein
MENAEASLHEIDGLYATRTNDDDGVALAIERFILNPEVETALNKTRDIAEKRTMIH